MKPSANKAQQLREAFGRGEVVPGGHVFFTDPEIAELLGCHGFKFVWIDAEHSAFDLGTVLRHIMACAAADTASIVRVAWNDPVLIKPVLEMGPDGLILPMIRTEQDARNAVAACRYPPRGVRGFGPRRANRYGAVSTPEYIANAESSFLRILQVEHRDAVENLEKICAVDGVDLLVIGPNDLSASYGHLGDTRHPDMLAIYDRIARVCKEQGMPFGPSLGAADHASMREWVARGATFLGCGDDISYLSDGAKATFQFLKESGIYASKR